MAKQAASLGQFLGYKTTTFQHETELTMRFYVGHTYAARVVEGCNAVSIIILFITFIIAFSGSLKATLIFGLVGSAVIYGVNIFRVLILSLLKKTHGFFLVFQTSI